MSSFHRCYWCQSAFSLLLIAIAVVIGWIIHTGHQSLGVELPKDDPVVRLRSLTTTEIANYHRDGTVLARNLLTKEQTALLVKAIDQAPLFPGTIFDLLSNRLFDRIRFDVWRTDATVASLALMSLPKIAASVLKQHQPQPDNNNNNNNDPSSSLRLLRDTYFAYVPGGQGCGWHVDDEAFWPTMNDTSGVTIWIALDDMTNSGGGLIVANRTALENPNRFLSECRAKTRSSTCDMERLAPECHLQLEQTAIRSWDSLKAGDAILWDRWVFHRTLPLVLSVNDTTTRKGKKAGKSGSTSLLRRYSVRFIPSNAKALGAIHASVQQGGSFVGSPYYPQVWPNLIPEEMDALQKGLEGDLSLFNIFRNLARFLYQQASDRILIGKPKKNNYPT